MSIKSDLWIRRMAEETQLITPFTAQQVREVEGRRIISAGCSSYGYDMRLADDGFRVFSPIRGREIDPKHFDDKSLIEPTLYTADDGAQYYLLPPHAYGLGVSVETFNMPRNVTGVCLGKSSYARCFRGDTRVALADGTSPTLEQMAVRAENGEMFWGYSVGEHGRIIITLLEAPRYIGRDSLLQITLDNSEEIYCTPDHEFLLRDGQTAQAHTLRAGNSLLPLYRKLQRGYEMVYQPLNGHLFPTHRLADEWNLRHRIYEDTPATHRHHIDEERTNNQPINIVRMEASEHIRYHNSKSYGVDFDPEEHGASIRAALERLYQDDEWYRAFARQQRRKALEFWHLEKYAEARTRLIEKFHAHWTPEVRNQQREKQARFWNQHSELRSVVSSRSKNYWASVPEERREKQRQIARQLNTRFEITEESVLSALHETGSIRGAARLLQCDRSVFRRFPQVIRRFKGLPLANHRIVSVKEIRGEYDVYCLTVPEAGNFALAAGVFVKNCGLLVNTTPLEAGWKGRLVIEIANLANLPLRVYVNEGIGQVLFFQGDEDCAVSYEDRGGKYQHQTGLTYSKL